MGLQLANWGCDSLIGVRTLLECLPEGPEGLPEGPEGLSVGPEALPQEPETHQEARGGQTDVQTDVWNFSPFYRTSSPVRAAALLPFETSQHQKSRAREPLTS